MTSGPKARACRPSVLASGTLFPPTRVIGGTPDWPALPTPESGSSSSADASTPAYARRLPQAYPTARGCGSLDDGAPGLHTPDLPVVHRPELGPPCASSLATCRPWARRGNPRNPKPAPGASAS